MRYFLAPAVVALCLVPIEDVAACGGFFCSQAPVVQTGEQIVFEIEGDVITAYIQLQFSGDDPNFAWVVPVPEVPEVSVGVGQEMFSDLESQTRPIFTGGVATAPAVADLGPVGCGGSGGGSGGGQARQPALGPPELRARVVPEPEVELFEREQIGPYEYVVLSAARAADLDVWLELNGYRTEVGAVPIVQEYLDQGMKLLAVKLRNSAGAQVIEPLKLQYRDSEGCARIPIRLTAIASSPSLEIVTWIFGSSRAVPESFAAVAIDPGLLGSQSDYLPAMRSAVSAAGGRAFVTELAQPTSRLVTRDPTLRALLDEHTYVTRLRTFITPADMTVDPDFRLEPGAPDVSNQIDLPSAPSFSISAGGLVAVIALALALRRKSR